MGRPNKAAAQSYHHDEWRAKVFKNAAYRQVNKYLVAYANLPSSWTWGAATPLWLMLV